jgi:hypothetical protein|tara:strand:+ start:128 stop:361 length:234 start_codon:yes stop_codon:yes gene_type:complete
MNNPWDSFSPGDGSACLALVFKLKKHVIRQDGKRCYAYLDLANKHWPKKDGILFADCPVPRELLREAAVLAKSYLYR